MPWRPGRVVVQLVFGQDGTQVCLADDQHAIQKLSAQGAGEALADRVHPRRLDRTAQDRGAGGLEYGVEATSEVRPAVADQEPDVLEPLVEVEGKVTGLLRRPLAGWVGGDAAQMQPAGAVLDEYQYVQPFQQRSVHMQKIDRKDPGGLFVQELPPGRA